MNMALWTMHIPIHAKESAIAMPTFPMYTIGMGIDSATIPRWRI
jgi:hypothetical protein